MSLPLPWVERIFDKLTLAYGQPFLARWRDIDLNAVKSDWCHELAVFEKSPEAIAYGLTNLPDRPPSVIDFKAICRAGVKVETMKLDAPKADPARVAAELAKLGHVRVAPMQNRGNRDWAHRIIQRHADGAKVTPTVLRMAKDAIGEAA